MTGRFWVSTEAVTPDAIRFRRFGVRLLRGLDPEEVRAFLYVVAEEWETVQRTNRALETQIRRLNDEVQSLAMKSSTSLPEVLRGAEPQTTAVVLEAEQNEAAATTRGREHGRSPMRHRSVRRASCTKPKR